MNDKKYGLLLTMGLIVVLFVMRSELTSTLLTQESWESLFSPLGIMTISFHAFIFLAGIVSLISGFWASSAFQRFLPLGSAWLRWLAVAGLLLVVTWDFLYSPWMFLLTRPWTLLVFAAGFVQLISLVLSPRRITLPGLGETALIACVFLFPRIVDEVRLITDSTFASRAVTLLGYGSIMALAVVLYHPIGERIKTYLLNLRERMGKIRWLIIVLFWFSPIIYHYTVGVEINILYANLRFVILLLASWVASFLSCEQKDRLVVVDSLGINLGMLMLVYVVDNYLLIITDYPFSLTWSEGNRFYDYSLIFGQSIYNYSGRIVDLYSTPGRYGLWGILFWWKDSPIWAHRLWNVILQIVPPLLYSVFITKKIMHDGLRHWVLLWIALFFIVLAPLHPPFVLASVIVAGFAFDKSPVKRGISLLVAGSYLAISRWTWVFAPAAMGALIDLFLYYPHRTGNWFRRLIPTIILAMLGMVPGLYINFGTFKSALQGELTTVNQPLLWYRLLPNDTLGPGVLLLVLLYTGPLLVFIAWWMFSKRWNMDIWQKLAVWGALTGFFIAGLVISTKIGGGGDLHNLDMYLVTLMLVVALGLTSISTGVKGTRLPSWAVSLSMLMILLSIYQNTPMSAGGSRGTGLADAATVQEVLSTIRTEVETASQTGEVLFMDQRQLLTFGYLPAIPFVPEYEKKYMMDQAMANNADYFQSYYQDLANQRFTLIVTEILRSKLKSELGGPFSEENDAFVTWVSNPTLCFYKPVYSSKETNIMLLAPRSNPVGCEEYLK